MEKNNSILNRVNYLHCILLGWMGVFLALNTVSAQDSNRLFDLMLNQMYDENVELIQLDSSSLSNNWQLFDVRSEEEYGVSHIEGAEFINFETYSSEDLSALKKEDTIIVYCSIGVRSQEYAEFLMAEGFENVFNLYGGIFEWKNNNNPVLNVNKEPTDSVHAYSKLWGIWLKNGIKVY